MSDGDEVCIISDSSKEEVRSSTFSSENEERSCLTEEEEDYPTQSTPERTSGDSALSFSSAHHSGQVHRLSPPLSASTSTVTDESISCSPSFEAKLHQQLTYFSSALAVCLNCPPSDDLAKMEERRKVKQSQLLYAREKIAHHMKRMRMNVPEFPDQNEHCGESMSWSGDSKRPHAEKLLQQPLEGLNLEKPVWLKEIHSVTTALQKLDQLSSVLPSSPDILQADSSSVEVSSPKYLLQPPPTLCLKETVPESGLIHALPFSTQEAPSCIPKPLEKNFLEMEQGTKHEGITGQFRCSRCAEVEVVLQKEGVKSIVPIYSELWRFRHERQGNTSLQIRSVTQQLARQEDLFDRLLQHSEKEWKAHHYGFLNQCAESRKKSKSSTYLFDDSDVQETATNSLVTSPSLSLSELRVQLAELQDMRKELDRLGGRDCGVSSSTVSPLIRVYRENQSGSKSQEIDGAPVHSSKHSNLRSEKVADAGNVGIGLDAGSTAAEERDEGISPFPYTSSLQLEIRLLKAEIEELRKECENEKASARSWELQYRTVGGKLHEKMENLGYIRSEAARILLETRKKEWKRIMKEVLGWEVQEVNSGTVILTRPSEVPGASPIRIEFTVPPSPSINTTSSSVSDSNQELPAPFPVQQQLLWCMDGEPISHPEKALASYVLQSPILPSVETVKSVEERNCAHNVAPPSPQLCEEPISSLSLANAPVTADTTSLCSSPSFSLVETKVTDIIPQKVGNASFAEISTEVKSQSFPQSCTSFSSSSVSFSEAAPVGWGFNPFTDALATEPAHSSLVLSAEEKKTVERNEKEIEESQFISSPKLPSPEPS